MTEKPKFLYLLVLLWPLLSLIFYAWGVFSASYVASIPNWSFSESEKTVIQMLFFGTLLSTIAWFVFGSLFFVFSYATLKGKTWVWTSGIILSTIFLAIFGLMLGSFMATALVFLDFFPVAGLSTVVIAFLIDLGIIYALTRPPVKAYLRV